MKTPLTPSELVLDLIDRGILPLTARALDALAPPPVGCVAADRVEGMLVGLATGDALGNTSEGLAPPARRSAYGEIRDYLPNRHAEGRRVGLPSVDTQLAFWTLESLLEHGRVVPGDLVARFSSRQIFGPGRTGRAFLAVARTGAPWHEAAQRSAGNAAAMRIAPVVLPYVTAPSADLWADAILAGAVTHNDPSSISACVALVGLLGHLLRTARPPEPDWWLNTYCALAATIEGEIMLAPRHPHFPFRGPIWRLVDTEVRSFVTHGSHPDTAPSTRPLRPLPDWPGTRDTLPTRATRTLGGWWTRGMEEETRLRTA